MNILALDTSGKSCSVALAYDGKINQTLDLVERQQSKYVLLRIQELLQEADIGLHQLSAIAFSKGPGSFTGIRLAASLVQGLAFGASLSVIPISTLQAMAQEAYQRTHVKQVAVATNAYGGKIYWGIYKASIAGLMQPVFPDVICFPETASLPDTDNSKWIGTGDAWTVYPDLLRLTTLIVEPTYPQAKNIARLASTIDAAEQIHAPEQVLPIYLYGAEYWNKASKSRCP